MMRPVAIMKAAALCLLLCCVCGCHGLHEAGPKAVSSNQASNSNSANSNSVSGGPCSYSSFSGVARVTEITPDAGEDMASATELLLHFDLARINSLGELSNFQHDSMYQVRLSRREVEEKKIKKGAEYRCLVRQATGGTCVPYTFDCQW